MPLGALTGTDAGLFEAQGGDIGRVSVGVASRPKVSLPAASVQDDSSDGFLRFPAGTLQRVMKEGKGAKPSVDQKVRIDYSVWYDAFDGEKKLVDKRALESRVSDTPRWLQETLLSMRLGERRRIVLPGGHVSGAKGARYVQIQLVQMRVSAGIIQF
ncbi:unnamed protein product [Vitrella brassicaformis CCMP3155]|uniref:Uncharacterized protein n=1 Tax=Vitrella brassicaformis (strain CCMP3155) TaxID=1169540 RepID=A0A0G4EGT2_VITBC|nr:unnamed protein product [Vitrella brassicaformis CCMP3155]|mmetsp:Transcript_50821/g.127518  ORF Transcript_50821/g.127518 Transcript_50821/m.127518 type:complete len:157 (-) Transcript_50821:324-794(-)|eukprot:CEL94683.1 unnamed protein product [Vitrella brassicaformis CCMP3155]